MKISGPLVSVVVITYNSYVFVVETLESIKRQTYKKIELIISDDGSNDQTVQLCNDWINANKERFVRTEVISVESNTGIPANCNRGFRASEGEWIKLIAGDDILDDQCIEFFVDFVKSNSDIHLVASKMQFFKNEYKKDNFIHVQGFGEIDFYGLSVTASQQYSALLRRNYIHAPSVLINKFALEQVGGFDEKYRRIEDYPLWLKLTQNGFKFHFMNKITVFYRLHESCISYSRNNKLFNNFYRTKRDFDIDYIIPNISFFERFIVNYEFYRLYLFDIVGLNKNIFICRIIYRIFSIIPILYKKFIHKRIFYVKYPY